MAALPPLPQKYKAVVFGLLVVVVTVLISAIYGSRGWIHLQRLEDKQREFEALGFSLQRENARLREQLRRLDEDDTYVEKLARERLGWIKPGETIYRVRGSLAARERAAAAQSQSTRTDADPISSSVPSANALP